MNTDAVKPTRMEHPSSGLELGRRLLAVLALLPNRAKAVEIAGRSDDMLGKYAKGKVEPPFSPLARLCLATGVRIEWLATGEEPQFTAALAETRAGYGSQELSEDAVSMALQITDDIIRDEGARYVPRVLYARLFRLMLQGVTQGLPIADVYDVGSGAFRGLISGSNAEGGDDGKQAMGGAGQGGGR